MQQTATVDDGMKLGDDLRRLAIAGASRKKSGFTQALVGRLPESPQLPGRLYRQVSKSWERLAG